MNNVALSPISRALRKPWYWFWRTTEKLLYAHHAYTLQIPFGHRVLSPWFGGVDQEFDHAIKIAREAGPMAVSLDRCYVLYALARNALTLNGDMAECGVYTGGTANLIAHVLFQHAVTDKQLHLFDTFSDMPDTLVQERDYHQPGDFADTSFETVSRRLR